MSDQHPDSGGVESYPRQLQEGIPDASPGSRTFRVALVALGVLAAMAVVVATGFGILYAVNPMGDEWVCSDGEAPAGKQGSYNACFETGKTLPRGYEWDPFGNRPMPYNCDKDGWVQIERPIRGDRSEFEQDCVREGTDLPGRWELAEEE
ncbi:MAG TPA: hypothetical protein VFO49_07100 [Nocardioides sp.]|nr:hypothetical protein [Nocardioides sp.]